MEHESRHAIDEDECWQRLRSRSIGRFATTTGGGPTIVPVNYVVHDNSVYFRTGPGRKVDETWAHPDGAFEVDGEDAGDFWSVVVEGTTQLLALDDPGLVTILEGLVSLYPSTKTAVIELTPTKVTGRRFRDPGSGQ